MLIAVYIDSLVMISIERSEANKKRALEIQDKIFLKGKFFLHDFSIKHDILRLFAKKKEFLVKIFQVQLCLGPKILQVQNFFKREIFSHNFSIKHDILRLFAKKKKNFW